MMLPLNPLYELVPVTDETMPEVDVPTIFLREDGCPVWHYVDKEGFDNPDSEYGKLVSCLRPLPPERMEEMVREIVGKAWDASAKTERAGTIINVTQKQPFTDNLINEMSK